MSLCLFVYLTVFDEVLVMEFKDIKTSSLTHPAPRSTDVRYLFPGGKVTGE
jgi:hypothetical protein